VANLDIQLFGMGSIRHGTTGRTVDLPPSVRSILGYLVLNRDRLHHRDAVSSQFWPDVSGEQARNRFSTALWRLRRILEPEQVPAGTYLLANRQGRIAFNTDSDHRLDVADFEQAASRLVGDAPSSLGHADVEAYAGVRSVYGADLLEGSDLPWLTLERERLAQLYVAAEARALRWHADAGELDEAVACGRRVLEREPLREDIHRTLIRIFTTMDQRSEALRQFETCRAVLRDELGVLPLPETVAAAAQVSSPADEREVPSTEAAVALIESASQALQMAASDLEKVASSLRKMNRGTTPRTGPVQGV
jgi:DNA-binding SARP family transcriptional activator